MPHTKKSKRFLLHLSLFCLIFLAICSFSFLLSNNLRVISSDGGNCVFTVVIDAGHGGEDGGASGVNGVLEKDLNLALAELLCRELDKRGVSCVMTRTTDTLLYDRTADYEGKKKALDMKARLEIARAQSNAIFVSIHQNSYPTEKYSGFQVYFSQNDERSSILAELFERSVRESLQPENRRHSKSSDGKIYLLDELECPAVLLECGFISNAHECGLLCSGEYQRALVSAFCDAIIEYKESYAAQ